jgi:ABC-type multidrug transport system fused ATPase/permease subunit
MVIKIRNIANDKWKFFQLLNGSSMILYYGVVCWGVVNGFFSVGQVFIFYTYMANLMDAASNSTDLIDISMNSKSSVERMMPIYWTEELVITGKRNFPSRWENIVMKNGGFTYQLKTEAETEETYQIEGLNFSIHHHEKIGIAGLSGGGKSTFAKLFLGLYKITKGEFKVDTVNYSDLKHDEITNHVSIVLQDSEMFNMSLRDNITLLRKVSSHIFTKAIQIAQLEGLISTLPNGVETLIGEKGYRLSGGERQRIGIARAICKDPEIFVFDEATSALDSRTESLIHDALEFELKQKTMIIIAHRISTLKHVDKICVFEKGRIVEEGKYEELLKSKKSRFYEVYVRQKSTSS